MKDHVHSCHLTKSDDFGVNRDEGTVNTLKHGSKSIQTSVMLRQRPPKPTYL